VTDPTLQTYETAAERYREQTRQAGPDLLDFLDRLAALAGPGAHVLEIGSGPGNDAVLLEARGLRVTRTDATTAFVAMMQADGFEAAVLDVRTDDLGGPYDAVLADAVLLHLTRDEFALALRKARAAAGLLAFTLKEGDGDAWTTAKLDLPRHFTYWREEPLREVLTSTGWWPVAIERVQGREPWLYVLCHASLGGAPGASRG